MTNKYTNGDYQNLVKNMVDKHILYNVNNIIQTIADDIDQEGFYDAFVQQDYETPCYDSIIEMDRGDLESTCNDRGFVVNEGDTNQTLVDAIFQDIKDNEGTQDFCDGLGLEGHENDVLEFWLVSDWLAYHLEKQGEIIATDFYGLTVWGRTCSGQAILLDSVICNIFDENNA